MCKFKQGWNWGVWNLSDSNLAWLEYLPSLWSSASIFKSPNRAAFKMPSVVFSLLCGPLCVMDFAVMIFLVELNPWKWNEFLSLLVFMESIDYKSKNYSIS